jgi:pimeloyl-ACP methyl ester carboxylesterase
VLVPLKKPPSERSFAMSQTGTLTDRLRTAHERLQEAVQSIVSGEDTAENVEYDRQVSSVLVSEPATDLQPASGRDARRGQVQLRVTDWLMAQFKSAGGRASQPTAGEFLYDPIRDQLDLPLSTLLVYGDKDVRAPLTVAKDLEAAISDSTLVVLPDSGHVCNIEAPEEFNKAVRNFLAMCAADH